MFGFSRREKIAVLFLLCFFIAGLLLYWYRDNYSPLPDTKGINIKLAAHDTTRQMPVKDKKRSDRLSIEINSAKEVDFEKLPGIGPITAARIVSFRKTNGGFESISQLMDVKGIGEKVFNRIKPYVFVKK
ncbi:helix-hairpin-helix domain-containing protein [bacterium]|nr:helix-hairpin-helix domain-containing protein [bacterium]